ncbi:MAG: ABC transporter permease [Nitrosarchaeum sp.]|nr:ABC transporter permease [Nitrosarchaeum sp.]
MGQEIMFQDIYTIWLREMLKFVRARSRIASSLAMPFIWLFILGFGFSSSITIPGLPYIGFLAPGIIGMIILFTSIFSGISIIYDRQFGFLKEILVAPVSRSSIVIGKTFGGATIATINGLIVLGISSALGFIDFGIGTLLAIPFMILIAISFVAMGLIIASRMKNMEGFQMIMSFLVMPIFLLSGALFPLKDVPDAMKVISYFDPLSYGIDGIRGSLVGITNVGIITDFTVLLGISVGMISFGTVMFKKSTQS